MARKNNPVPDATPVVQVGQKVRIERDAIGISNILDGEVIFVTEHIFTVQGARFCEAFTHTDVRIQHVHLQATKSA